LRLCIRGNRKVCIHVFRGTERDYVLNEYMCSCPDYVINVVGRGRTKPCYHILALRRASDANSVVELEIEPEVFEEIVFEIVSDGFSKTLRQVINSLDSLKK